MLKKTFRLYRDHYVALLRLGVPIMIGQLGIIIVGFADNIMVGHHTSEELAAASFVNTFKITGIAMISSIQAANVIRDPPKIQSLLPFLILSQLPAP